MAVTRSWAGAAPALISVREPAPSPGGQWLWLIGASLFVVGGLASVYAAKSLQMAGAERLVNLNTVESADRLLPLLEPFPNREERELVAQKTFDYLESVRPVRNVGALAGLRVTADEIESDPRWDAVRKRLRAQPDARRFALLPLAKLKPLISVRTSRRIPPRILRWSALYFAGFYLVALVWRAAQFRGDRAFLPALHLLSGIGFVLMASMRDPLRDTLEFHKFALGAFRSAACCWRCRRSASSITAASPIGATRRSSPRWRCSVCCMKFGRGPAGNDAKVNLGPFQPVEVIKILLVLFLAGYFTRNWERLRDLREKRVLPNFFRASACRAWSTYFPCCAPWPSRWCMFFELKDLGPALVMFFVFLSMFARGARAPRPGDRRPGADGGFGRRRAIAWASRTQWSSASTCGFRRGITTSTAAINWRTALWAFSTGGPFGSGPGWGDPAMIPAGNTDLVLPAIGEEWGFLGVCVRLPALRVSGFARAARGRCAPPPISASSSALGLACLIAYEMMLISSGVLGALPLSGVVSPFLSSGNTAMLANFLIFALLASISADPREEGPHELLRAPTPLPESRAGLRRPGAGGHGRALSGNPRSRLPGARGALVRRGRRQAPAAQSAAEFDRARDSTRRPFTTATASRSPPAVGRNSSSHRADYEALGISLDQGCSRFDTRHYPFGAAAAACAGRPAHRRELPRQQRLAGGARFQPQAARLRFRRTGAAGALSPSAGQSRYRARAGARPQCSPDARYPPANCARERSWKTTCALPAMRKARWW